MATTSDSAITGEAQAATENAAFLPRLVAKILRRRSELGEGQWLSEELRIALEEMAPLLEGARVSYEVVHGFKDTVLIKPMSSGGLDPANKIEAYSIKMMASCLNNPSNQFLSHALEPQCRKARQRLIDYLGETCRLLMDPEWYEKKINNRKGATDEVAGGAREPVGLAASRERKREQQRARLLATVMAMTSAASFRLADEVGFWRIFDAVWRQVEAGSLAESIAAGKILDRIYAERRTKSAAKGSPEVSATLQATVPSPALPLPAKLPAILDSLAGQGLTAHRIFLDLQKTSDLNQQVERWACLSGVSRVDVEYLFILHVLNRVARFDADGETVTITVPPIPKIGCAEFEKLVERGKARGAFNIDPRIWGVIGGVYSFTKNWLGPQLHRP